MSRRSTGAARSGLGRRELLRGALACAGGVAVAKLDDDDWPSRVDLPRSGLISRQKGPENLEFPLSTLDTGRLLTANEQFYVRTHFGVPALDTGSWRLPAKLACEGNGNGRGRTTRVRHRTR
jgi:hypothetical protein